MKPLYSLEEFEKAKCFTLLPLECCVCKNIFHKRKELINKIIRKTTRKTFNYCSSFCFSSTMKTKQNVKCTNCNKIFLKKPFEIKKSKNHFCSSSCSAIYGNAHKNHGTKRSKIEKYFEKQLCLLYPEFEIHFNRKDAINSELDIYIPSLNLAFELNGIFHYEPIFGSVKLQKIKNNDQRKFQACIENNIELVLIDISSISYFKEERANKFLHIITNIINKKKFIN